MDLSRLTTWSRLVDLDSKLTGIINQLSQGVPSGDQDASPAGPSLDPSPEAAHTTDDDSGRRNPEVTSGADPNATFSDVPSSRITSYSDDFWNSSLDISVELLNHLLGVFRSRQKYFPFVVISNSWTAQTMMTDRPFLLLAIITSVTGEFPSMQDTLALELRNTLSQRIVVAGENNLDLLQGLLVHLAWYHHHLVPRSQLAYRTLQIAISMAIDLGLDRDFDEKTSGPWNESLGAKATSNTTANEQHRAALGCYYLSSVISATILRPNRLPFDNNAFKRASILKEAAEVDTDRTIQPLIRLQRIVDRARTTYNSNGKSPVLTRLHTHAEQLMADLDEWWFSLPSGVFEHNLFSTRYYSTRIWIYEMGLVYHFNLRQALSTPSGPTNSSLLIANLIQCVEAVKEYLDCFLAMPVDTYPHLPAEEYFRLIMAFFVVYKLAARIPDLPFWDLTSAREILDLERYLDVASSRIRQSRLDENTTEVASGDVYSVLPEILDSAKASYAVARDYPEQALQGLRAHTDVGSLNPRSGSTNDAARPSPSIPRGCPATGYWKRQAAQTDATNADEMADHSLFPVDDEMWNNIMHTDSATIF